jgi:seryl-tRNA synthetase
MDNVGNNLIPMEPLQMNRFSPNRLESIADSLFRPGEAAGVQTRSALFEHVMEALSGFINALRSPATEPMLFPPVMSRALLERSGYLKSFPHLLGCVSCLNGKESEVRERVEQPNWADSLAAIDLVLSPAACYPVYPLAAKRGPLPDDGLLFDVSSWCFRHEATYELDRMQSFRMREFVRMGSTEQVLDFRERWLARSAELAEKLGLPYLIERASDPFFGRAGRIAAINQLEQSLKFEWLIPVISAEQPTACMSFNYHRDHFGGTWHLVTAGGQTAHTACVAFGMDRLVLALFATHGVKLDAWPASVRNNLSI